MNSGAIFLDADVSVRKLYLEGGTLSGNGTRTLTVLESGRWSTGTIVRTALKIEADCTFEFSGDGPKQLVGAPGVITNAGTVTWLGGPFNMENNAQFANLAEAVFDVRTDTPLLQSGGGTSIFTNQGTYRKSTGGGTHSIDLARFENSGTVDVDSGVLRFGVGTTVSASGPGNSFHANDAASMQFNSTGSATSFSNTAFSGPGAKVLNFGSGAFSMNGAIAANDLVFASGTWQGEATVTGALEWSGGTISQAQVAVAAGSVVMLSGPDAKRLVGAPGVITNAGTVTWEGGPFNLENNAQFVNLAGAVFDVRTDTPLLQSGGGTSSFRNEGTYRKSAGTGTHTVNIASFTQAGALEIDTGIVQVVGNYTQGPTGALKVTVAGPEPGTGFGQLIVTGTTTLDGALTLVTAAGLELARGESLPVITAGSRTGFFSTVSGGVVANSLFLATTYSGAGTTLRVAPPDSAITALTLVGERLEFHIIGVAGQAYRVDASIDLIDWKPLTTITLPGSGVGLFTTDDIRAFPQRLYRSVFAP